MSKNWYVDGQGDFQLSQIHFIILYTLSVGNPWIWPYQSGYKIQGEMSKSSPTDKICITETFASNWDVILRTYVNFWWKPHDSICLQFSYFHVKKAQISVQKGLCHGVYIFFEFVTDTKLSKQYFRNSHRTYRTDLVLLTRST